MQWQDILADKSLQDLPYKIELNELGIIEMSPASVIHSLMQAEVTALLRNQMEGRVFTELAVQTKSGVRVSDVAWGSDDFVKKHIREICASSAPEICVEIISPSNSQAEMDKKIALFIEAGAKEVWRVDEKGHVELFDGNGRRDCSQFDVVIKQLI